MPQGGLNPHASGALILFVKASGMEPLSTDTVDLKSGNLRMQIPVLAAAKPIQMLPSVVSFRQGCVTTANSPCYVC
jgi:hypothetical protein